MSRAGALPEIYAYGVRNSQRFAWDSRNGAMFMTDIGQNIVEEVSPVTAGANLGWNVFEGSYRYVSQRAVITESPWGDASMVYPIVEWDQLDPVLSSNNSSAAVSLMVYRSTALPQLSSRILFGDMPSGAMFHVSADTLPTGGQDAIRLMRFVTGDNNTAWASTSLRTRTGRRAAIPWRSAATCASTQRPMGVSSC